MKTQAVWRHQLCTSMGTSHWKVGWLFPAVLPMQLPAFQGVTLAVCCVAAHSRGRLLVVPGPFRPTMRHQGQASGRAAAVQPSDAARGRGACESATSSPASRKDTVCPDLLWPPTLCSPAALFTNTDKLPPPLAFSRFQSMPVPLADLSDRQGEQGSPALSISDSLFLKHSAVQPSPAAPRRQAVH